MQASDSTRAEWLSSDPGWFFADGIGSVRSSASYRPGGWWFLPEWLPDSEECDVGPFRTKAAAIEMAEKLTTEAQNAG